uniref:RlmI-like PUA domain-containing protein n=1 Tax=Globisporangium ultimum (strain ATCC 200006 / CBS 805.95 / DAOM BR144) TaxID=431595 RepID=K3WHB6_GLOUD
MVHLPSVHLSPKGAHRWLIGGISWIKSSDVVSAASHGYELTDGEIIRIYNSESEFLGVSQVEKQNNNDGFVLRARSPAAMIAANRSMSIGVFPGRDCGFPSS